VGFKKSGNKTGRFIGHFDGIFFREAGDTGPGPDKQRNGDRGNAGQAERNHNHSEFDTYFHSLIKGFMNSIFNCFFYSFSRKFKKTTVYQKSL
jgi:hypothetical protein